MPVNAKYPEWFTVVTAIVCSLLVAADTASASAGFALLLISAMPMGVWAHMGKNRGIFFLQLVFAHAGFAGMFRWSCDGRNR
jgi:hypothetical protein